MRDTIATTVDLATHAVVRAHALATTLERDGRRVAVDAVFLWSSIQKAARLAEQEARATPRVARVLSELARLAAVYRLAHLQAGFLPAPRAAALLSATHAREAARVRALCEGLGGGLLKVGQLLSARADLLPAPWIAELARLQDAVPPPPHDAVLTLLDAELGPDWPTWLALEEAPIAAASIAVVYRGRLLTHNGAPPEDVSVASGAPPEDVHPANGAPPEDVPAPASRGGRHVAIKVQRPEVENLIAQDERALRLVSAIFTSLRDRGLAPLDLDLRPLLAEVARGLSEELDFAAEASMATAFRAALHPRVHVPEVVATATRRVVIMEFVEGARLTHYLDNAAPPARDHLLGELARALAHGLLVHGLAHGDPHPGNFLVADRDGEPTLVMLDFGAALELTDDERQAYLALVPAALSRNEDKVADCLTRLGFSAPDPRSPARVALELVRTLTVDLRTIDARAELERGLALMRAHPGLVIPPHFVRLGRALAAVGGLFMQHRPELDVSRLLFEALLASQQRRPAPSPVAATPEPAPQVAQNNV